MSFYGDVDLEEPSDCEGGTDSSDDDGLYALMNNRSRPAQRRRHRSSSRGSSSSRSRSRSRSLSRSRLTAANTVANANTSASANSAANSSSAGVARLHLLEDALVGRDDVERLVADSQRHSADALVPGGASRKLIAASAVVGASKAAVAADSLEDEAADFERMMEEELDRVVVKHVEEQKRRWMVERGIKSGIGKGGGGGGRGDPEDVDMEVDDSNNQSTTDSGSKSASVSTPSVVQEFYDDIYFDSDDNADDDGDDGLGVNSNPSTLQSSSIVGAADSNASNVDRIQRTIEENDQRTKKQDKKKKKHPVLTNDELFYDPNKDDEDQKWVDDQRRKIFFPSEKTDADSRKEKSEEEAGEGDNKTVAAAAAANEDADTKDAGDGAADAAAIKASVKAKKKQNRKAAKARKLPNSDATLSCPGCITTLTMDCQKHEIYAHQYRAMFVSNCVVDTRQVLTYPKENNKKKKSRKSKKESDLTTAPSAVSSSSSSPIELVLGEDKFHPVRCAECETQVAVYDKDEIYYFFNVLASH